MATELEDLVKRVCREKCLPWFETYGKIDDKHGDRITPESNLYQAKIAEVIQWMRKVGLPARLICLKPRQRGSSTYTVAELYHEARERAITALIVGGSHEQSGNLYRKLQTYAREDEFQWGNRAEVNEESAKFHFNAKRFSLVKRLTAANEEVGRSDTYQFLLATEPGRWAQEGVANAANVMSGLLKTVGPVPGTTIIMESTAHGASGDFYDRYWAALPFEEFKARYEAGENMLGRYVRVFSAWFEFPDTRQALSDQQRNELLAAIQNPTQRETARYLNEVEIMAEYGLTLEQMAWRRWAIDEECKGDPNVFEEDYPSTEESAFVSSGAQVFNVSGMKYLRGLTKQKLAEPGMLEWNRDKDRVSFRATSPNESTVTMWEKPVPRMRYILAVDVMTGASQNGGKDPDQHAPLVLRAGFNESGRGWIPPAVVARIKHPCIWDLDVLEEHVYRLSKYYGNCLIIPEMNMDRGLVELLKLRPDANIYQREKFNERESKMTQMLGWMTDKATRPRIVATLARAIREFQRDGEGVTIWDADICAELETFIRKENGREEASPGKHDDNVLALAIGLENIDSATRYREVILQPRLPRDLELAERGARGSWHRRRQYS